MRLILYEDGTQERLYPLTYTRPVFELRCGRTTLREKIERACGQSADAVFVRDWLKDVTAERGSAKVNDLSTLKGDDLLLVNDLRQRRLPSSG